MKKHLLAAFFCSTSFFAMAQTGWFDNYSESQNTFYYSYGLYNNTLFPDSTVQALYGNGLGGSSLYFVSTQGMGEVFDPKSYMYNNPLTSSDPYKVDSIGLWYQYHYVPEPGAAPDTLIFQFYTGAGTIGSGAAIDTGYFAANPSVGFPQEPADEVKYDYTKNLGAGAIAQVKYILKPTDTSTIGNIIRVATNGANGISVKANDLFAYTVSYRPGFRYKPGDTIDELVSPPPAHLHSHFKVLIGNSTSKDGATDFEQSLTIYKGNRYNLDPNWDGLYIPGTAWTAYNQILWSAFHIQIKQNVKISIANDAGVPYIQYPSGNICAGQQPVKVSLENFGSKTLTSVRINWAVYGAGVQTPYLWTGSLDSGYSTIVTIGTYSFTAGIPGLVIAYTSLPNGVKDSVSANDSSEMNFDVNPLPVVDAGSSSSVCSGKSVTIGATQTIGNSYSWSSNPPGFTSTDPNPAVNPVTTTKYELTETIDATGCSDSGSVVVTVNPLPNAGWTVTNADKYYTFKANDNSLSASSYVWNFGDGTSTVTGASVTHVFLQNISYQVKLKITNGAGCTNEGDSTIDVTVSGIAPNQMENIGLDIYPNPATNLLNLVFASQLNRQATITITDQLGQVVGSRQIDGKAESYNLDISGLAKGIYILNVQTPQNHGGKYIFVKE